LPRHTRDWQLSALSTVVLAANEPKPDAPCGLARQSVRCTRPPQAFAPNRGTNKKPRKIRGSCKSVRRVARPCRWAGDPQGDSKAPQEPREKPGSPGMRGTDSGTLQDAGTVEALAAALQALSPADRARLAALLVGQPTGQGEGKGGSP